MALVNLKVSGSMKNFENFLFMDREKKLYRLLTNYGKQGVELLKEATPVDTGKTASSWQYEITVAPGRVRLYWTNSNVKRGLPIALLIQYGHATRGGTYVEGIDYINPALAPIFDEMADKIWKEVAG